MSQATSVGLSNYPAIQAAVLDIANTKCGITFKGTSLGEIPLPTTLKTAGTPFLAVRYGKLAGFSDGENLVPVNHGMRAIGMYAPVWDFDVYALYGYSDSPATNPAAVYAEAATGLIDLLQGFGQQYDAEGQCESLDVVALDQDYMNVGGQTSFYVMVSVRCTEQHPITY